MILSLSTARPHPKGDFHACHHSSRSALFRAGSFRIFTSGSLGVGTLRSADGRLYGARGGRPAFGGPNGNQVIVQASREPGEIRIEAMKEGWDGPELTPAKLVIVNRKVEARPAVS